MKAKFRIIIIALIVAVTLLPSTGYAQMSDKEIKKEVKRLEKKEGWNPAPGNSIFTMVKDIQTFKTKMHPQNLSDSRFILSEGNGIATTRSAAQRLALIGAQEQIALLYKSYIEIDVRSTIITLNENASSETMQKMVSESLTKSRLLLKNLKILMNMYRDTRSNKEVILTLCIDKVALDKITDDVISEYLEKMYADDPNMLEKKRNSINAAKKK